MEQTLPTLAPATLPPRGPQMDVLRPGKDQQVKILFLGHAVELYRGHWGGAKTIACQLGEHLCPHCLAQKPSKVFGFSHCLDMESGKECTIMLTPDGCWNLQDAHARHPRLRGFMAIMRRHMNRVNRPYVFLDQGFLEEERIGIKAKSCEPTVRRIWHFEGVVDPRASRG